MSDVFNLHQWANEELRKMDAGIDAFYYCPHYPKAVIEKYRMNCRKPAPGLILQAISYWNIDKNRSFLKGRTDIV